MESTILRKGSLNFPLRNHNIMMEVEACVGVAGGHKNTFHCVSQNVSVQPLSVKYRNTRLSH